MRILKSSLIKKILWALVIVWCSGIFLNGYVGVGEVHAEGTWSISEINDEDKEATGDIMGTFELLDIILKLIYILLRPLLVVAGLAMDNTLVYASLFHLDAPLWKFWNMMKNFANFALWFMVLFAIIKSIVSWSGWWSIKDEKTPLGIIKQTLIAGILVQASWFIMAVLVDISTITTYAIGGLPLSVLGDTDIGNQRILTVNSTIDLDKFDLLDKEKQWFKVYYSTKYNGQLIKISPCRIEKDFVIGRELGGEEYINTPVFAGDPDYEWYEVCALFGNQLVMWKEDEFIQKIPIYQSWATTARPSYNNDWDYKVYMNTLTNTSWWDLDETLTAGLVKYNGWINQEGYSKWSSFFAASESITIGELIDKSKGFVWPLVTMYSSLLNFAQLTDTNVTSLSESSGIFIIKTGIAIALFFPLLALAAVLIARIALLWLFIIWSPFIIIKATFKDFPKMGKLDDYISIKSVMGIIFAPVVTVAALSLSLIFMTALISGFKGWENQNIAPEIAQNLQIEPIQNNNGNQTFNVAGISEIEFQDFDRWWTLDRFSWLIVNFFAIGLLWTIVFAAIKSNSLGKAVGEPIEKFGKNFFETMPIIPFNEWQSKVGIGSFTRGITQAPQTWVDQRISKQKSDVINRFIEKTPEPTYLDATNAGAIVDIFKNTNYTDASRKAAMESKKTELWITSDITATENMQVLYSAIWAITDTREKSTVIGNLTPEMKTAYTAVAKSNLDTAITADVTLQATPTPTDAVVTSLFNADPFKKDLDEYFGTVAPWTTNYTISLPNNKVLTVTQSTTTPGTYTATIT